MIHQFPYNKISQLKSQFDTMFIPFGEDATVTVLSRVYVDVDPAFTKPIEWAFIDCQKEEEHIFKWIQIPTLMTLYPGFP